MRTVRNIVLSVLFSLAIISCRTTVGLGEAKGNMAVSENAENSDYSLNIYDSNFNSWGETSGSISNITDTDENTSYYFYRGSTSGITTNIVFTITPKTPLIEKFRVKMKIDHKWEKDDQRVTIKITYKNGSVSQIYDGGWHQNQNIDETFSIYDSVAKIEMTVQASGFSFQIWAYGIWLNRLFPSEIHIKNGSDSFQVIRDDTNGSCLKYKGKDNNVHSLLLVDSSHIFKSNVAICTPSGIKYLAKYST